MAYIENEYETKVVELARQELIPGGLTYYRINPNPAELGNRIAEFARQGWEVVSVNVQQDSGWLFIRGDASTTVILKRKRR